MELSERRGLGRAIRVYRTELGLSRRDLEERTRLSYPYLSEIEAGKKTPSPVALQAITNALGVPEEELLERARNIGQGGGVTTAPSPASAPRHFHEAPGVWRQAPAAPMNLPAASGPAPDPDPVSELISVARSLSPDDLRRLIDLARRLRR